MRFLLDTNIVSEGIQKPRGRLAKLIAKHGDKVALSTITACELRYGESKFPSERLSGRIGFYLKTFPILPLHPGVATIYGTIRAQLEKAGTPIGPNDLLIAAHALHQKLILVTRNEDEFKRVPGLKVENWF